MAKLKKIDRRKIRRIIGPFVPLIFLFLIVILLLYGFNLLGKGRSFYSVYLTISLATGLILSLYPKYSYYGSLIMTFTIIHVISLSMMNVYLDITFNIQLILSALIPLILLPIHHISKEYVILRSSVKNFLFPNIAYVLTTLFLLLLLSITELRNLSIHLSIISLLVIILIIIMNQSYREYEINSILDISNLTIFDELHENIVNDINQLEIPLEITISEFSNSINSYIDGNFDRVIEDNYKCLEGLEKIIKWSYNEKFKESRFKKEYKEISLWRNKLAHSKIRKKEKEKEYFKIDAKKALRSINITYNILLYYSRGRYNDIAAFYAIFNS